MRLWNNDNQELLAHGQLFKKEPYHSGASVPYHVVG
jgi:hypothetical protein